MKEAVQILYGKGVYSESYQRYALCKEFGWDYFTFQSQPVWFIEELSLIMNQESQKAKSDAGKSADIKSVT